jgi:hypothetical protein
VADSIANEWEHKQWSWKESSQKMWNIKTWHVCVHYLPFVSQQISEITQYLQWI